MTMGQRSAPGLGDILDGEIRLQTAEGPAIRLGAFFGQVLVIQGLRYYG